MLYDQRDSVAQSPAIAVFRELIRGHLCGMEGLKVLTPHCPWWDEAWRTTAASLSPQFILLHDQHPLLGAQAAFFLRVLRVDVALFSDIMFEGPRVLAHCIPYSIAMHLSAADRIAQAAARYAATRFAVCTPQLLQPLLSLHQALETNPQLRSPARIAVTMMAAAGALQKCATAVARESAAFVQVLLLHTLLLDCLPLAERILSDWEPKRDLVLDALTRGFLAEARSLLAALADGDARAKAVVAGCVDLFDGRLFHFLVYVRSASASNDCSVALPRPTYGILQKLVQQVLEMCGSGATIEQWPPLVDGGADGSNGDGDDNLNRSAAPARVAVSHRLLPFDRALIAELLPGCEDLYGEKDEEWEAMAPAPPRRIHLESLHWHSGKELLAGPQHRLPQWKVDRARQRYIAYLHKYAESLGETVSTETVILKSKTEEATGKGGGGASKVAALKPGAKEKKKQKSKADLIRESNTLEKADKARRDAESQLRVVLQACSKLPHAERTRPIERFLAECKSSDVAIAARVELLRCQRALLLSAARAGQSITGLAVQLLDSLFKLIACDPSGSPTARQACLECLVTLNFKATAELLRRQLGITSQSLPLVPPEECVTTPDEASFVRFQLRHMGPLMERNTEGQQDPRVSFRPDKWQVRLLDVIDRNESALVCAPTSSGKTFISYYAMRRVLESSVDGVVVYVAPTKALVNQVSAEVYARWKDAPLPAGHSISGIFTRDYRHNYLTCRILITVPQCLEILLLSPPQRDWVARLKYLILDEVHSIGERDTGTTWEHLLLMAPCPFVALSATVGNPELFHAWLVQARSSYNERVHLVRHDARYSELRKMVFVPPPRRVVHKARLQMDRDGDDDAELKEQIVRETESDTAAAAVAAAAAAPPASAQLWRLHPLATLSARQIRKFGLPLDLAFESSDTLCLFDAMNAAAAAVGPERDTLGVAKLAPEVFFKDKFALSQADARQYEAAVKQTLVGWAQTGHEELVARVLRDLDGGLSQTLAALERQEDVCSRAFLFRNMLSFLRNLQRCKMLPAIVFSFDRYLCTNLGAMVSRVLQRQEAIARAARQAAQPAAPTKQQEKRNRKARERAEEDDQKNLAESALDADVPDDEFSFVPRNEAMPMSEVKALIAKSWLDEHPDCAELIPALYRGIGVHHGGLPKKYQQLVEILFRARHLRVVFATGTLALGINMPCPTVVFAGDSNFLNALQYRQMSGRAGRRGFDTVGNVIFFGVPYARIASLVSSPLPTLRGHFPLTVTMVLRSFQLLSDCTAGAHAAAAKRAIANMLRQPFFSSGRPHLQEQIGHHFRFSIEFLRQQLLLDARGRPLGYAGLVAHLYHTEPANLVFYSAQRSGILRKICCGGGGDWPTVSTRLMVLLSHLFGRIPLARRLQKALLLPENARTLSPSVVVLEPLPAEEHAMIADYNANVLAVFTAYIVNSCARMSDRDAAVLPLSRVSFLGGTASSLPATASLLLRARRIQVHARSPFIALSGHGDAFADVSDLVDSVRSGVFMDWSAVPVLRDRGDRREAVALNAYLLDFYRHGQLRALYRANQIRPGDAFQYLKDFALVLLVLAVASETAADEPDERTIAVALRRLANEFSHLVTKVAA